MSYGPWCRWSNRNLSTAFTTERHFCRARSHRYPSEKQGRRDRPDRYTVVPEEIPHVVLGDRPKKRICRFLEEYTKQEQLQSFGLAPKRKLLFFGPPGNGKTLSAEVIAGE